MKVYCHEFDVHEFEYARSKLFSVYDFCVVDLNLWRNYFLIFSIRFKINFITFSELTNGNVWRTAHWTSYMSPSSWLSQFYLPNSPHPWTSDIILFSYLLKFLTVLNSVVSFWFTYWKSFFCSGFKSWSVLYVANIFFQPDSCLFTF